MKLEQIIGEYSEVSAESNVLLNIISSVIVFGSLTLFLFSLLFHFNKKEQTVLPIATEFQKKIQLNSLEPKSVVNQQKTANDSHLAIINSELMRKQKIHHSIYQSLLIEFANNLSTWSAIIDKKLLLIRFQHTDILFKTGETNLNSDYQNLLSDFFPRYVAVLKQYQAEIEAISIEGHSSPEWTSSFSQDERYLNNMLLSQQRTYSVLEHCLQLLYEDDKTWLQRILSAKGLSASRPVIDNELENFEYSRRVEFRIYLK